ncbi:MAG: L-lactate permease [Dorea sp.]
MSHSEMIAEIAGMLVTLTGDFYPAAAPFVGAIGTFVTGSGTSANVLFGGLQVEDCRKSWTGSVLACGSEYSWGDNRKDDFSGASIAIGTAAFFRAPNESTILRKSNEVLCDFYCNSRMCGICRKQNEIKNYL